MPTYNFTCNSCDTTFDVRNNIINRDVPLTEPCKYCGESGKVVRNLDAPPITSGAPTHIGSRVPDGFKDVLRNIKKGSGKHCTIDINT